MTLPDSPYVSLRDAILCIAYGEGKLTHDLSGDSLWLVKEPDNEFDPNAIAVYHKGTHLGFVPRTHQDRVLPLMPNDEPLEAILTHEAIVEDERIRFAPQLAVKDPR